MNGVSFGRKRQILQSKLDAKQKHNKHNGSPILKAERIKLHSLNMKLIQRNAT